MRFRLRHLLLTGLFFAGIAGVVDHPSYGQEKKPTAEQLRNEFKELRQAGKSPSEIVEIFKNKYKGLDLKELRNLAKKEKSKAPEKKAPEKPESTSVSPAPAAPAVKLPPPPAPRAKKPVSELAAWIDSHISKTLQEAKISPSPLASDEEFLRRIYLDLTGVIPTAEQAREFLDSTDPNKRARLIDQLLDSPNFGRHMADIWQAKLLPKESANRFIVKDLFIKWMAESFNKNMPWDQFVTQLIAGTGTVAENPAVTFILANQAVDKLTDHVGNHFLNIQLQCAQCHNHPFIKDWKQDDYWGMAAFFSKVQPDRIRNANKGGDNTQIGVYDSPQRTKAKDFFPEATRQLPPKFFMGDRPQVDDRQPLRPVLAQWMTHPDNPYFGRAMVNRIWAQLFGPGFVNPIEDMHPDNPPSHPELLDGLAEEFSHTGYDLKHLFRVICNSQTYQRSSKPTADNKDDSELFSHQTVKVMTPEQMFDSLQLVIGSGPKDIGRPDKFRNANTPRDSFVNFFLAGADEPSTTSYEMGIPQALRMMNSRIISASRLVVELSRQSSAQSLERLYLSTLSRRPTAAESQRLTEYIAKNGSTPATYEDILWAILNSSEFMMVR